jgi:3-deoxy-D-manno-octulosonic acid (KDO) 8-phosphate synthase
MLAPQLNFKGGIEMEQVLERTRSRLLTDLVNIAQALPVEKINEILDFAGYLSRQYAPTPSEQGSAEAILRHAGKMQFEPRELGQLLTEIEQMRELDLEQHDPVSP